MTESITFDFRFLRPRTRTLVFIIQIAFIGGLLIWWFSSESVRQSKSLWVFFLYSFPAEFVIASVPHEPVILYFSKFYAPLTITLVAIAGTAITEIMNYSAIMYMTELRPINKVLRGKIVQTLVKLFSKTPFAALWVAGITPIPFYPFRFLAVRIRYPLHRYITAVVASRTPRFYLLALFSHAVKIPDYLLVILTVLLVSMVNISVLRYLSTKRRKKDG